MITREITREEASTAPSTNILHCPRIPATHFKSGKPHVHTSQNSNCLTCNSMNFSSVGVHVYVGPCTANQNQEQKARPLILAARAAGHLCSSDCDRCGRDGATVGAPAEVVKTTNHLEQQAASALLQHLGQEIGCFHCSICPLQESQTQVQ